MNRCKTCQHYTFTGTRLGTPSGVCGHPRVDGHDFWTPDSIEAVGYDAGVTMGPEFGCVHHEEKS